MGFKAKVTKKDIINHYTNIIKVGYCEMIYLMHYKNPNFYTAGKLGWNADIYEINPTTVIVTGYRPFGNIEPKYDVIKSFDLRAREIINNKDFLNKDLSLILDNLINEFILQVKNQKS